ncbi:MAG: efflux RND transporter periplasmic adaptor subunit [Planctomycetaceae bacterium]|nr:efflux RND transporter periplasmic adaptor subunit [Planctomycetaceae bacterium]MBV8384193.1 efflux RND transporter periplasmic adaptor subunit [Planctomycetaceae bacterium]
MIHYRGLITPIHRLIIEGRRDMSRPILTSLLVATLGGPVRAAAPDPQAPRAGARAVRVPAPAISISRCVVDYARSSHVGAALTGAVSAVLQDCHVQPGDRVKAGQVLGRLVDQELRAEMEARKIEAESDLGVRIAEAKSAQAMAKLARSEVLIQRRFLSQEEFDAQRMDVRALALEVEQAKHRRRLAQVQYQQVQAAVHAREFVSPHDGVVVEVLKNPGEVVGVGETVFQVVEVDHLKITGALDVSDAWQARKGMRVRIMPDVSGTILPIEREEFMGEVTFVDSRIDPETRTCKVVARVENREGLLRSGLEARMEIFLDDVAAVKPATR